MVPRPGLGDPQHLRGAVVRLGVSRLKCAKEEPKCMRPGFFRVYAHDFRRVSAPSDDSLRVPWRNQQ